MTAESPTGPTESVPPAATAPEGSEGASPGQMIRRARERVQMGLEELAAQTKLARPTLEALEKDDFTHLTEPVYVQGYYRKCAKVLGLSETALIETYRRVAHPEGPHAPSKLLLAGESSELVREGGGHFGGWWIALIVIILIVLAGIYVNRYISQHAGAVVPKTSAATTPVEHPAVPVAASPQMEREREVTAAQVAAAESVAAAAPSTTTAPGAAPAQVAVTAPATPSVIARRAATTPPSTAAVAGQPAGAAPQASGATAASASANELTLTFTGTSWVRITDAKGTLLLSGVVQAGQSKTLQGTPPFALFLGNAPGVQVRYEGRPVSTAGLVQANNTARLSVPQAH
ncbi:MAG TPA: RodZ domain-containing protein [Nevskiaceae bacterium]|nr:RodZ domain-containing protein [Nevskiaceae bacterium]